MLVPETEAQESVSSIYPSAITAVEGAVIYSGLRCLEHKNEYLNSTHRFSWTYKTPNSQQVLCLSCVITHPTDAVALVLCCHGCAAAAWAG